jgi:hypothetical protein
MPGGKLHVMKLKGWCPQYLHVGVTGQSGLGVSFRKPVRHQQRGEVICGDVEADSSRSPEERRIIHVLWDEHTLVMQLLFDHLRRMLLQHGQIPETVRHWRVIRVSCLVSCAWQECMYACGCGCGVDMVYSMIRVMYHESCWTDVSLPRS